MISRVCRRSLKNTLRYKGVRGFCAPANLPVTTLSEDEQMFKEMIAKFAQETVLPHVREMDETKVMKPEILDALFENGFMGIEIEEEYGGAGASFTSAVIAVEELAKVDPSLSASVDVHNTLVNNCFRLYGSDFLKEKYLPRLAQESFGSFCLTESGSGTDAFSLRTKATKIEGEDAYLINGEKMWISNSGESKTFIVFANVDPSLGYKGITAFVVERDTPGLKIAKPEDKLGIRSSSTCVVTFEDVKVNSDHILGEIGKGYKYSIETLNEGRIGIAAQMIGCAQGAFDATMPYLGEREQFGTKIGKFQGMEFQYAEAATEIEAARLLVYNAARMKENGQNFVKEAAMAKWFSSEVAGRVCRRCVEWMGGVGFTKEYPQEKFYRDNLIGAIYEGTSNIQLHTIAKLLQKEYW